MATMKKAQTGMAVKKPVVKVVKKTTVKVTPKRDRSKDNPADEYKGMKDAKGNPAVDVGGEGRTPPFKKGGVVKKAKTGISVPKKNSVSKNIGNLNKAKDGKSFPDLNKDGKITKADILKGRGVIAQKGATVKKKTGMDAVKDVGKYVSTFGGATERDNPKQKDINIVKKLKETGTKVKNKLRLKSGGSMKKCKYGCK